jgi:selenobiotic family peptide radical SAM maturase
MAEDTGIVSEVEHLCVNPSLQLLQLSWRNLPLLLQDHTLSTIPERGQEFVLAWRDPDVEGPRVEAASNADLLVLKMVVEEIAPRDVAAEGGLPVGAVDAAMDGAVKRGILLAPRSRICRDPHLFPVGENTDERFLSSSTFALQWHITQVCDLHCKHCYDRSNRSPLKLEKALKVLDDLRAFCRSRYVRGHVSFTGGNPLLYPHFFELYRAASERGFVIAILGNPAPRERIEELIAIQPPAFFQVSLEGLRNHNDAIRGPGNFGRVMTFLGVLRDLGVCSMVMLTLTKDNMDQILPLGEMLRHQTDAFFFNRLSMVGEGASLQLPSKDEYASFLEAYMEASKSNPVLCSKDNLFNILRHEKGLEVFDGCTGFGCGAAFNFLALLSDGEVHACRKFPSPLGNVFEQSISDIYDCEIAQQYRSGCKACRSCAIRPVCGGCLAMAYSHGLDVFEEKDPYCFMTMSGKR